MSEYISGSEGNDGDADFAVNTQNDSNNPESTAEFELPKYDIPDYSMDDHLTTMDISNEICADYWRGRSMLFEIARKERRWTSFVFRNKDTRMKLAGPALELDRAFYTMIYDYRIHRASSYGRYKSSNFKGELLEKLQELILNDLEIKTFPDNLLTTASATATLLGLNKRLRDDFIQPLKQCMVNKQEVDYKDLLEKVTEIHEEVVDCYRYLNHQFSQREEKIMEKAMIGFPEENQSRIMPARGGYQSRKVLGRGEYQSHKVPVREEHQREKLRQGGFGDDKIRDEKKIGDEEYLDVHNGLKT
ncbi:hypothetical protein ABEW05_008366 [Botrytis cinerea]